MPYFSDPAHRQSQRAVWLSRYAAYAIASGADAEQVNKARAGLRAWQTCRPSGPASTKCLAFQLSNHAIEPGLFEPQSPLPGNEILRAETKRPKPLRSFKDALAETKSR